ncbi:MAG: hypothetical protein ABMA64_24500 [Myxococcota bacterium]
MTARYLLALAIALGVTGCTGTTGTTKDSGTAGDDDDAVGDDDDDVTGEPTGDTAPTAPGGFEVKHLQLQADLAFDASTNSLVEVQLSGGALPSAVYLLWGTDTWKNAGFDQALDSEYCFMMLPMSSSVLASWATADATVWYGVDYVDGVSGVFTDCNTPGKEFDPALLGADPVSTLINDYGGWGVGIGEWGPTWYDFYDTATTPDFFATYVGARVYSASEYVGSSDFLAFPVELDPATFEPQDDGTAYIGVPASDVYTGTGIATAWYRIFGLYYYSFN